MDKICQKCLHNDLNFLLQYSGVQQSFLDILVINQDSKMKTDTLYEETDCKQCIFIQHILP